MEPMKPAFLQFVETLHPSFERRETEMNAFSGKVRLLSTPTQESRAVSRLNSAC
jgi:hypothetical protein